LFWDLTQMLLLIYVAFSVTLTIGFDMREHSPTDWIFWLEVTVDVYFLIDLVLQFFTSYVDSRGIEIVQVKAIAKHYVGFPLQGSAPRWFWLDLASGFPLNYIMMAIGNDEAASTTSNLRTMKVARLAKLLKLLRIARAGRILKRHEDTIMPLIVIHGLTILLFFSLHGLACFWFLAGLTDNGGNCLGTTFTGYVAGEMDCGRGWVIKKGWRENTDAEGQPCHVGDSKSECQMQTVSLGFAYTTALSDIFMRNVDPETSTERVFVIFAVSVMLIATTLSLRSHIAFHLPNAWVSRVITLGIRNLNDVWCDCRCHLQPDQLDAHHPRKLQRTAHRAERVRVRSRADKTTPAASSCVSSIPVRRRDRVRRESNPVGAATAHAA
jgi:hypothetical protein